MAIIGHGERQTGAPEMCRDTSLEPLPFQFFQIERLGDRCHLGYLQWCRTPRHPR
jgi:hypothetical protein